MRFVVNPYIPNFLTGINVNGSLIGYTITDTIELTGVTSFLFMNGLFYPIKVPWSPPPTSSTFVQGIDKYGNAVGYFTDSNNVKHGFARWIQCPPGAVC
jgi:hypothetical protein